MANGTNSNDDRLKSGQRIKKCRKMRGLSREQLIEKIELLPDNRGRDRSEKQLSYLENGTRSLSLEYATLLSQALQVRIEYLLLKDDFITEEDVTNSIFDGKSEIRRLIIQLIKLHGYEITTKQFPVDLKRFSPEELQKYNENPCQIVKYVLESHRQDRNMVYKILDNSEIDRIFTDIDDFIEFTCSKHLKRPFNDHVHSRKGADY